MHVVIILRYVFQDNIPSCFSAQPGLPRAITQRSGSAGLRQKIGKMTRNGILTGSLQCHGDQGRLFLAQKHCRRGKRFERLATNQVWRAASDPTVLVVVHEMELRNPKGPIACARNLESIRRASGIRDQDGPGVSRQTGLDIDCTMSFVAFVPRTVLCPLPQGRVA
jgi:hypothetical protein